MGRAENDLTVEQKQYLKMKNGLLELAFAEANLAIVPTKYQASSFPKRLQNKITILHEGVKDELFEYPRINSLTIGDKSYDNNTDVITFISRNLEPMRGFHTFMRALATLQK